MTDTIVLIPTYNNAATLADVVSRSLSQGLPVMVVDDGSTDSTPDILKTLESSNSQTLTCIRHPRNMGKGTALKTGFKEAKRLGYSYVITLDSDGQHFPEDIPVLLKEKGERSLVVGSSSIRGKDGSSSFANNFSNFWFRLYTWVDLPDTQTGYRMYPLNDLPGLWLLSSRYEAELTLLVFSAWKGLHLKPVPVKVAYTEDRVSHFHPVKDFARITLLNTILLIVALLYGYPRMMLQKIRR
jgi:glycosyltransferase involved in cell wall biosynthesis